MSVSMYDDNGSSDTTDEIETAINRYCDLEVKRRYLNDTYFSLEVKRGRLKLGIWRDNEDWFKPVKTIDVEEQLVEELEAISENDDWTFDPLRKALRRMLSLIDRKEKQFRAEYEAAKGGETNV